MAETRIVTIKVQTEAQTKAIADLQIQLTKLSKRRAELNKKVRDGITLTKSERLELGRLQTEILGTRNRLRDMERTVAKNNNALKKNSGFVAGVRKGMTEAATAIGAAVVAFRTLSRFVVDSVEKFNEQVAAEKNLETALGGVSRRLLDQASALQKVTTFGDEATIAAQTQLATLGLTEDQIEKLTPLVLDLSARTGKDLTKSTKLVTSALATGSTTLEKFGVELSASNTLSENLDLTIQGLEKSVGGTAEALAKTGTGPLKQLQNSFGDFQEQLGEVFIETLNELISIFRDLGKDFQPIVELFARFKTEGAEASEIGKLLANVLTGFFRIATITNKVFAFFVDKINDFIDSSPRAQRAVAVINEQFSQLSNIVGRVPAAFEGVLAAGRVFFAEFLRDAQERLKGIGDIFTGVFTGNIDLIRSGLSEQLPDFSAIGGRVADAFNSGYNNAISNSKEERDQVAMQSGEDFGEEFGSAAGKKAAETLKKVAEDRFFFTDEELVDLGQVLIDQARRTNEILLDEEDLFNDEMDNKAVARDDAEQKRLEDRVERHRIAQQAMRDLDSLRLQSAQNVTQGIINLAGEETAIGKRAIAFQKTLALAEVIVNLQRELAAINANPVVNADITQATRIALVTAAIARGAAILGSIRGTQFAKGGIAQSGGVLNGPSHAQGGIPFAVGGRVGFEAEGGEAIINKRSTAQFGALLSAINQAGGGVAFGRGGKIFQQGGTPQLGAPASARIAQQVADATTGSIGRIEVVNVATNTTDVAAEVQNIQSEASF